MGRRHDAGLYPRRGVVGGAAAALRLAGLASADCRADIHACVERQKGGGEGMIRKHIARVLLAVMLCVMLLPLPVYASGSAADVFDVDLEVLKEEHADLQKYAVPLDKTDEFDFYVYYQNGLMEAYTSGGPYRRGTHDPIFSYDVVVYEKNTESVILRQRVDLEVPEVPDIGLVYRVSMVLKSWDEFTTQEDLQAATIWGLPAMERTLYNSSGEFFYEGFLNLAELFNLDAEDMQSDNFYIHVTNDSGDASTGDAEMVADMLRNPSVIPTLSEPVVYEVSPDYFGIRAAAALTVVATVERVLTPHPTRRIPSAVCSMKSSAAGTANARARWRRLSSASSPSFWPSFWAARAALFPLCLPRLAFRLFPRPYRHTEAAALGYALTATATWWRPTR